MCTARGPHSLDAHLLALGAHISWGPGEALRSRVTLEDKHQQLGQGEDTFVPSPPTRLQTCGRGSQPSPGGAAGGRQVGPEADAAPTWDVPEDRHTDGPTQSASVHLHRCAPWPARDTSALPCSCVCVAGATRTEGLHVCTWRGREVSACSRVRLHLDEAAGIVRLEILARSTRARGPWTPHALLGPSLPAELWLSSDTVLFLQGTDVPAGDSPTGRTQGWLPSAGTFSTRMVSGVRVAPLPASPDPRAGCVISQIFTGDLLVSHASGERLLIFSSPKDGLQIGAPVRCDCWLIARPAAPTSPLPALPPPRPMTLSSVICFFLEEFGSYTFYVFLFLSALVVGLNCSVRMCNFVFFYQ